ncbi:hypothetical protein [Sphingobacterium kyonggiense]
MNIKEAIKALLQTKFGGVQLSATRVYELVKRLDGKVKDETELEVRLVMLDEAFPFSDIAKEDDRVRSQQVELEKLKKTPAQPAPTPEPTPAQPAQPAPAEDPNKAILEAIKGLTDTVAGLKSEKVVNDRRGLITSKLKDAGEDYANKVLRDFGRMSFADDAAFEEYLGDIEKDYATHVQTQAESKLGFDGPFAGVGKDGRVNEATQAEVDQLFGDIKI